MASDKMRTQAYTAVICIAERSVTAFPEDEVPIKNEPPPDRFLGLSLDRNMLDINPIFIPPNYRLCIKASPQYPDRRYI